MKNDLEAIEREIVAAEERVAESDRYCPDNGDDLAPQCRALIAEIRALREGLQKVAANNDDDIRAWGERWPAGSPEQLRLYRLADSIQHAQSLVAAPDSGTRGEAI